jgi:predicted peptidase/lysophospholipase L1-like esterase
MLKKLLTAILSVVLVITLGVSANVLALKEDVDMDMNEDTESYETFAITNLNGKYKTQGRTSIINNVLMVDYSASGIEFSALCEGNVSVTFNAISLDTKDEYGCYFTVIVDGVKQARDFCRITATGDTTVTIAENLAYGEHTFEIYRQTEIERANIGIKSITLFGIVLAAPQYNDMYVEFIGDSISTAYGNLTPADSGVTYSAPKYQDVTQGYAYLTARALGVDWSIVAQQGRGAKYGYTPENLQDIYPKLRYHKDKTTDYAFAREPDYVVIALGTNDINTYSNRFSATLDDVKTGFEEMLALVRAKNPNSKIVWAYNMMTNKANDIITSVINEAGGELNGYYSVKLTQNTAGGNGHPYYTAHAIMAEELSAFINKVDASLKYGLGDADENNSVNLKDLVKMAQYAAEWEVALNKVVSDVNGDKKIDLADVTYFAQYLAGWDVALGAPLTYTSGVSGVAAKHLSVYSDQSGFTMPYTLYVPKNYDSNKEYPVVLYFHGASGKGNDGQKCTEHLDPFYKNSENAKTLSEAIVIAPQCPQSDDALWGSKYAGWWKYNDDDKGTLNVAMRLLDDVVLDKYNCDANRLYVMGVSMGGEATWKTTEKYADRIAAAVPICGSRIGNTAFEDATKMKDVPIWMYHGTADTTIPFTDSETRYNNLIAAGNTNVTFTRYEGLNHDIWDDVALDTQMLKWMFEQNLNNR